MIVPSQRWDHHMGRGFTETFTIIVTAFDISAPEKQAQEERSLNAIGDPFKKIIVVRDNIKARRNEKGIVTIGIRNFLLDKDSPDP